MLLVEDEDLVRSAIALGLTAEGLVVDQAADAAQCRAALEAETYEVVALDLGLPDQDGVHLAAELRERADLGLVVVTRRAEMEARIEALDVGADDYLVKPIHYAELAARIRSVARRRNRPQRRAFGLGDWQVDLEARTIRRGADEAGLTRGEFDLLARLADAEGRAVNRDDLLAVMSRNPQDGDSRTVDMLISRIRRKLGAAGERIVTVPGFGYRLSIS